MEGAVTGLQAQDNDSHTTALMTVSGDGGEILTQPERRRSVASDPLLPFTELLPNGVT